MNFTWNSETIRWYTNANDYSGFFKHIAADIAPSLSGCESLADLGCGPGLFDFEVCHLLKTVECIDVEEAVLSSIRQRAMGLGIMNIETRLADCYELRDRWDAIYMSFFGAREPDRFLPFCKKLFAVVMVSGEAGMFPGKVSSKKSTVEDTARYLNGKGIPYTLTLRQYEFGQPFTSLGDAARFARHYMPDISDARLEEYLGSRLKETHGEVYPYYSPRRKDIGIFELEGTLA